MATVNHPDIRIVDTGSSRLHLTVMDDDGREKAATPHRTLGLQTADMIADSLRDAPGGTRPGTAPSTADRTCCAPPS
ncbi:hypothetical protein [Streptomyces rubiginosohelvolus]